MRPRKWLGGLLVLLSSIALSGGTLPAQNAPPATPQKQSAPAQEQKPGSAAALPRGKKLYLKDGSYQLVRSYEQKGERVRYYSVERSAWEEIPASMVDLDATRKSDEEAARIDEEIAAKKREIQAAKLIENLDADSSLEVAPGVFLPEGVGMFLVEGKTIRPMAPVGAEVKLDKGRLITQILVPIPVVPTRHKVQIPGPRATMRVTTAQPEFYIRTEEDTEPEIELIRARVKSNAREIERINTILTGERFEDRKAISVQRWKVARNVYRLTMSQSLEPGEYVLAELVKDKGIDLGVWDFGVDVPAATKPSEKK